MSISNSNERVISTATAPRREVLNWSWQNTALSLILLLTAGLRLIGLDKNGFGNTYYAAAVKSMLTNWHNFFFVSFDSAGFVSVDKPPLGLWLQTLSAKIFGFSGFSLVLPEILAGIGSVALLYYLVQRTFNPLAGLIAALVLALTPISVAVDRNNTLDSILVFFMLLAAWAFFKAAETGQLRWLVLGSLQIGLGFNVKMVEAFMVLPAFYLVYVLATHPRGWLRRVLQLVVATIVILVISFSWATIVELTPASQRPYVGSSSTNSVYNLIFGYNGLGRQTGTSGSPGLSGGSGGFEIPADVLAEIPADIRAELEANLNGITSQFETEPGAGRLLAQDLAGQVSWLLPLALLGALALAWRGKWSLPLDRRQQSLVLWSGWLLTCSVVFSFTSGIFHSYYLVMLAPPVAALVGAGLVAMWQDWQSKNWRGWLLPAGIFVTTLYAAYIAGSYPAWSGWLLPLIIGVGTVATLVLIALRLITLRSEGSGRLAKMALGLGLIAIMVGPTAWALTPVLGVGNGTLPEASPQLLKGQGQDFDQTLGGNYDINKMVQFLETNQSGGDAPKYLLATVNATSAAPVALKSNGRAVMAMGGFLGSDPILTTDSLAQLVKDGQVRYFLLQDLGGFMGQAGAGGFPGFSGTGPASQNTGLSGSFNMGNEQKLTDWVQKQCKVVDATQWGGQNQTPQASSSPGTGGLPFGGPGGGQKLYDCLGH